MTGGWFIIVLLTLYNIDIVTIVKGMLNNEHTLIDLLYNLYSCENPQRVFQGT